MSKLRTNQLETLDGLNTVNVSNIVDDINTASVTTSTGTQSLPDALNDRAVKIPSIISAADYGLVDDIFVDNTPAIQAAIDDAVAAGGGTVILPAGGFGVGASIVIKSGVYLRGAGIDSTVLRLLNDQNNSVIVSEGFDSLTGTGAWLVSEGVPVGFGVFDLSISGNWNNNSSGDGIKLYAKRYFIDRVLIFNCTDRNFYSECGAVVGQETEKDMPEAFIGKLYLKNSGNHGMLFRGPHDARIDFVAIANSGNNGFRAEQDTNYAASCDIGELHVYSCDNVGVVLASTCDVEFIESESNSDASLVVTADNCYLGYLKAYLNQTQYDGLAAPSETARHMDIRANNFRCSGAFVGADNGGTGVLLQGDGNQITNLDVHVRGADISGAQGIHIIGSDNQVTAKVRDSSSGSGFRLGDGSTNFDRNSLVLQSTNCQNSVVVNKGSGSFSANSFQLLADTEVGQSVHSGENILSDDRNRVDIFSTGSESVSSRFSGSGTVNLGITSEQTVVIPHNLPWAPTKREVTAVLDGGATLNTVEVAYIAISSTTSTDITVKFKLRASGLEDGINGAILVTAEV